MNNTGNPVGSKAFLDFEDNVRILDQRLTSDQDTFQDRLGKSRLTWAGIEKAGSGDPAIAVDAAARAVAAAGRAEAAEALVDAANIQDYVSQAEAARDAAFVNADVYATVAEGRAAVADGEQFQVVEGDDIVRYRKDSATVATEVARSLSAAGVLTSEKAASIFSLGADFVTDTRTRTMIRALRGVYIERYEGQPVRLELLHLSDNNTKITIRLEWLEDGVWQPVIVNTFTLEHGVHRYEAYRAQISRNVTVIIDSEALALGVGTADSSHVVNGALAVVNSYDPDAAFDAAFSLIEEESGSIFYADAFIQGAGITRAAKRAIKQVRFEGNNSDRKLALQLLNKSGTKLQVQIRDITDISDTFLITGGVTVEDYAVGVKDYTLPILAAHRSVYGDNVYITLDIAPFEEYGYITGNSSLETSVFRDIEWGLDVTRIENNIKAEVSQASVFVPSANFVSGGVDVTDNIAKVVKSIKFFGDTVGLKPYINELIFNREAGTATISISDQSSGAYQQIIRKLVNIPVSGEYITTVMTYENSIQAPRFRRDLVIEVVWKPELLQSNIGNSSPTAYGNYFRRGILSSDKLNAYEPWKHKSIRHMLRAGANYPLQTAGALPYRLSDEKDDPNSLQSLDRFVPMWNAIKLKRKAKYELIPTIPPSVEGHYNNHAFLGDLDSDGRMWFYGVSDKKGRIYYSDDEAQTLVEHSNLFDIWPLDPEDIRTSDMRTVWCLRVLANDELGAFVTAITERNEVGEDDRKTFFVYTTGGRAQWNLAQFEEGGDFHLDHFIQRDGAGNITFVDPSRMIDGWGFDQYENYVLAVGYGAGVGTPTGHHTSVGYGHTGGIYLSKDYGQTWSKIFDYFNMPEGCTPFVNPLGGHHSHGGFFDFYQITDGKPRIVGIMGDQENRLVISDDLGQTWTDNAPDSGYRNDYQQAVCGCCIPQGYLTGTDAVAYQGIQLTHRATSRDNLWSDELVRTLSPEDEVLAANGRIVHVGVEMYQRGPEYPIITAFTPETSDRYDSGTRGQLLASWDGGLTWSVLYDERHTPHQFLRSITAGRIRQDSKRQIWFVPRGQSVDSVEGSPEWGWVVKITYD